MNKLYKTLAITLMVAVLGSWWWVTGNNQPTVKTTPMVLISPDGSKKITFKTEIANTEELRRQGLMHRTTMAENTAMLFVWPQKAQRYMWMKNTLISLDMLFIDNYKVLAVATNAQPMSEQLITKPVLVNKLLEINAGLVERYQIGEGWRLITK